MDQENIQKPKRGRPFGYKNKPKKCTTFTEAELALSPHELFDPQEAAFYEKQIKEIDLLIEEQEKTIKQAREMRNDYVAKLTKLLNSTKETYTQKAMLEDAVAGEQEL